MTASRRDFLMRLAAAGLMAKVPPIARAKVLPATTVSPIAPSPFDTSVHPGAAKIRIGYASITWEGHDTQAVQDISALGYPGIQLRTDVIKEFPDPHALRDLLAQHKLIFVALSSGDAPLNAATRQSVIDEHVKHARYLKAAGGRYLQVIGSFDQYRAYTAADYQYEGRLLTEIGKRISDYGIQMGFHNHMNSVGQTPHAVDAILEAADPTYVKLELDTAHYLQGGGDPVAAIRKYATRLLFLHLKDVRDNSSKSGYEFTELGRGRVDFPSIFAALDAIHFRGWGIVELDGERPGAPRTPKQSAALSRDYLEQKMSIRI